jgi:hypothetical protein
MSTTIKRSYPHRLRQEASVKGKLPALTKKCVSYTKEVDNARACCRPIITDNSTLRMMTSSLPAMLAGNYNDICRQNENLPLAFPVSQKSHMFPLDVRAMSQIGVFSASRNVPIDVQEFGSQSIFIGSTCDHDVSTADCP